MLKTIDRIQIATRDAELAAAGWRELLGAEFDAEDQLESLGAKRITFRLGRGAVEFLEPDGPGAVADALEARGRDHLFAGGISTGDFDAVVAQLRSKGVEAAVEHGQAFFDAAHVLGVDSQMVLSPVEDRPAVGNIDFLYEVTLLAENAKEIAVRFAGLFSLDESHFVPIASERFAYDGVLTLFDKNDLHRFEIITPHSEENTMGRFFKRTGTAYYMSFAESSNINQIGEAADASQAGITIDRPADRDPSVSPDQAWVHPPGLAGVMLGLSRPTMAWMWSGHPERVQEVK